MKEYKVILVETIEHEIMVQTDDTSEIGNKVIAMIDNNEIDFTKGKTVNTQLFIDK
jgi:hypothetical protein